MDETADQPGARLREPQAHWDSIYQRRGPSGVSWYQSEPMVSLDLLAELTLPRGAAVVDVGGGASCFASRLLERGFRDLSVVDISGVAIAAARSGLPAYAPVNWFVSDVLAWHPPRRYDLWHDRAVFHFLVSKSDIDAYLDKLGAALVPGGFVAIGTFAADGPASCSGLPVTRYAEAELARALGDAFAPVAFRREIHRTPSGVSQPFTWLAARRVG